MTSELLAGSKLLGKIETVGVGDRKSSMLDWMVNKREGSAVGENDSVRIGRDVRRRDSIENINDTTGIEDIAISGPRSELVRRSDGDGSSDGSEGCIVGGRDDGVRISVGSDEGTTLLLGAISIDVG
jgi:hypothetical protein